MNALISIFSKLVDSSLWEEDGLVVKVFIAMLAKQDRDHIVRGSVYNIARWANETTGKVARALNILSEPDRKRKGPQPFDGRRIQLVDDGWLLLNGAKYQELMRSALRRAQQAEWARLKREKMGRGYLETGGSGHSLAK